MDALWNLISNEVGSIELTEKLFFFLILISVFFAIVAIILLISSFFDPVRTRFLSETNPTLTAVEEHSGAAKTLMAYRKVFMPSNSELLSRTELRLHHAGYHKKSSVIFYFGLRLFLTIALPVLTIFLLSLIPGISGKNILVSTSVALGLGFIGPSFVLDAIIKKRQKILQRAFPDALDLLVVCTEAGLSLNASLQKVTEEISISHPELADEMDTVLSEIQAGVDRNDALRGLVVRTGVDSIRGLMATLSQCLRFGTDIAEALRVYSEDLRDKRKQEAEALAAKIPAKIIFPMALCLLPCFILIILVPIWLNLMKSLSLF